MSLEAVQVRRRKMTGVGKEMLKCGKAEAPGLWSPHFLGGGGFSSSPPYSGLLS